MNGNTDACIFYETAKKRLLDVNQWHHLAGTVSSHFLALDKNGKEAVRIVQKGDYIRIDIPGPGSKEGNGYDWAVIEELKEISAGNIQSIGFRVRPAANPLGNKNTIAHFYDQGATSNFTVTREENKVTAFILDRNILPNHHTSSLTDKIRDTAVGMIAIAGFSKIQWQNLANGLVKKEE